MPVACGQTWEASTYNGHWPNQNSIDLGEWSANDTNIGQGEPVLASAAGTVLDVFTDLPAGDIRVYLDHGGGWVTHYIHLESVPPLVIGQHVAQGEQIGRVGNTGTVEYHLHYTQLADGNAVRSEFNGQLIDTGVGNLSPWGNGEKLTSATRGAVSLSAAVKSRPWRTKNTFSPVALATVPSWFRRIASSKPRSAPRTLLP